MNGSVLLKQKELPRLEDYNMQQSFMINACLFSEENLIDIDSLMICSILTQQIKLGMSLLLKEHRQHHECL